MTSVQDPRAALHAAKRWPLVLLIVVALGYGLALALAAHWGHTPLWLACLRAVCEAAMVGALADWFAVSALFRHIPIPGIARHTAIIPRNKDRIGENLAVFVRDRFLDAPSLVALMRRHDVAQALSDWLRAPDNCQLLGQQLSRVALAALEMVNDRRIERLLLRTLRGVLGQVDFSKSLATVLDVLTQGGRHQVLLDDVLQRVSGVLKQADTHRFIAEAIVQWIKREHPLKEKMLPTDWLGDKGAEVAAQALDSWLDDIAHNPHHRVREAFDGTVQRLIARLRTDPAYAERAERVRHYLLHDEKLAAYLHALWGQLRHKLERDLADAHSPLARKLTGLGRWLGQSLAQDEGLRQSMNDRLERWAHALAPEVSQFIARHISDTVKRWDAQELSTLIEQHIGKDLQYIRINGTLVGGTIGLVLFVVSHFPDIAQALGWVSN